MKEEINCQFMIDKYIEFYNQKNLKGGTFLPKNLLEVAIEFNIDYFDLIELLKGKIEPHIVNSKKAQKFNILLNQYLTDYYFLKNAKLKDVAEAFGYSNSSNCHRCIKRNSFYQQKQALEKAEKQTIDNRREQWEKIKLKYPNYKNTYLLSKDAKQFIESFPSLFEWENKYKIEKCWKTINNILDEFLSMPNFAIAEELLLYENECNNYATLYLSDRIAKKIDEFFAGKKKISLNGVAIYKNKLISCAIENYYHDKLGSS